MFETTLALSVSIDFSQYSTNMERHRSRFKGLPAASCPQNLEMRLLSWVSRQNRLVLAEAVPKRKIAKVAGELHRLQRFFDAGMGNQCLV